MHKQLEINPFMRAVLVNWIASVQESFHMNRSTFHTAIAIVDRYLNCHSIEKEKLQLLGITAFMIACKMEEVFPPTPKDCIYICDDTYKKEEAVAMERFISETLQYRFYFPTSFSFLVYFLETIRASVQQTEAANYYLELSASQYTFLETRPSIVAAGSVFLAVTNKHFNPNSMEKSKLVSHVPFLLLCFRTFGTHAPSSRLKP